MDEEPKPKIKKCKDIKYGKRFGAPAKLNCMDMDNPLRV